MLFKNRRRGRSHIDRSVSREKLILEQLEARRALAITTPFTVRYQTNDTGGITFAANTLMTAPASDPAAINAQNGIGSKVANNDFLMTYVDADSDSTTFNSSRSDLVMPAGSQVLFAGLYWGARTSGTTLNAATALRPTVKFMTPGGLAYQTLTGSVIGTNGNDYQSFKDVTGLVTAAGDGTYTVANVQARKDITDVYAGWSLVVAYRAPGDPARNLTIFDGYGTVAAKPASDSTVNIPISGFKAPTAGLVKATLGFIAYEGDLKKTGDSVTFDGQTLSDAANPASDFFNSTISNRGALVSTKDPDYVNQLGYDADLIAADGIIKNGATSATITMTTGGETYYPGVVTSAIDIFAPEILVVKSVKDENGGEVVAGDVLTYTMVINNSPTALDSAINVLLKDAIPTHTTYKPSSLNITSGVNSGSKTDASDGDQAEFFSGTSAVQFQLGTGAGGYGTSGGRLTPGQSTTVTFQVTVNAGIAPLTLIENTANVSYTGAISGFQLEATGFADIATQGAADLAVTKTDGKTQYVPGTTTTYTIVVTNNGPSNVVGASVIDTFPSQIEGATWTAVYSAGSTGSASGSGDINTPVNLLSGGTATFTVTAPVRAGSFGNLTNTVTVSNPAGLPDPDPSNNSATDTDTFLNPGNLRLDKNVNDLNGGFVVAGDVLRYNIVINSGTGGVAPSLQEAAANVILTDAVPANTTFKPGSLRIRQGANAGSKTDAVDSDQGEWISGTNTVQFQLGTGAGAGTGTPVGGTLTAGTYTEVEFDVIVDAGIPDSTVITNTADVTATGATSGLPLSATDTIGIATPPAADLFISKRGQTKFTPGGTVLYIVTAGNKGPTAVTGATVIDTLPAGLSGATWTATYAGGSTGPTSGTGSINALVNLATLGVATFRITATTDPNFPLNQTLTNTATVTVPAGIPDPNPDNNTVTVIGTPAALTDLSVTKTDGQTQYVPGKPVTYTIMVTNAGPSFASQAAVDDTLDPAIISSATWTAVFTGTGSTGTASGTGSISENIDLAVGGTAVYTVIAQTLTGATGSLTNTATVTTSDLSNDPNPVNNTATDTDTLLLPAELDMSKDVVDLNGGFVVSGDTLRYTIVVTNPAAPAGSSRDTAINVQLSDLIPAHTTYAGSLNYSQGTITGSQGSGVTGSLGTLAPGATATVSFNVTVNTATPDSTAILNNAFATGTGQVGGPSLQGEAGVAVITPPGADLAITKTAPATFVPGRSLTYTLVVSNLGPSTSTNALVQDTLPADVTGATWTVSYTGGGTGPVSGSGNVNATLTSLPANATATFTITATPDYRLDTPLANTATVAATDGLIDPDPDNNTSTVSSTPTPVADLQIVKTDGVTSYVPGQQLVYTITVTNAGPSFVTGAVVADVFDSSIITSATWIATITQGQADLRGQVRGTGSLNQTIDLGPGGTVVYTVTAITSSAATGLLVNTATVAAPDGTTDPNPANNTSTDVDTILFPASLTVVKSVSDLSAGLLVAGDTLRYTIVVSNLAATLPAESAANVILNDLIPANTTYKPGTLRITVGANAGAKTDAVDADQAEFIVGSNGAVRFQLGTGAGAGTGTPIGGTLSANQSTTVTFDVTLNAGTPSGITITNTATATGATSGVALLSSGSVGIGTAQSADLAIAKAAPATYTPGSPIAYTLVVSNAGPSTATNAWVQDVLPAGLSGATWTAVFAGGATGSAVSGSGNVNTFVTFPVGSTATFTLTATAAATLEGVLANTATVTATDGRPDPNPANNTSTQSSTAAPVADLSIVKTDGQATYTPGQPLTYTITLANAGPSFVRGATVADTFASVVTAASWTAVFTGTNSTGATAGTGNLNELIDLAVGGTATYTVVAQTSATATASLVNTATVAAPVGTTDPNPANNTSTDTDTVLLAPNLKVVKTVTDLTGDPSVVQAGDTLRYTIVISNAGTLPTDTVTNIFFSDPLPTSSPTSNKVTYAGNLTFTQGSLTGSQLSGVVGAIGSLAQGQSATITFEVIVDPTTAASTVVTNTATAEGTGLISGVDVAASGSIGVVTPPGADLVIKKTGLVTFTPGGSLTYTLVVKNKGPSTATGATVADVLPAELSGAQWTVSYANGASGVPSGSGNVNALLTLPKTGKATFTITATVAANALAVLTNTATVTSPAGTPDPNPFDNTSTFTSTPVPVNTLSITKTDGQTAYKPGESVTYTIVVSNAGPSFAQQVSVTDLLDPAVIESATWTAVFTGAYSAGQTIGTGSISESIDLAVGGTATYTVVAQTLASASVTLVNTAQVTAPNGTVSSATDTDTPNFSPAIILGTDVNCTSTPLVRVIDPVTGIVKTKFYAYEPTFRGGVRIFGQDMTGDGIDEIITAPGPGRVGEIRVWSQNGVEFPAYRTFPFGTEYIGGIEVTAGRVISANSVQLIASKSTGVSQVSVFQVTPGAIDPIANTSIRTFQPFPSSFRGGATVTTADVGTFAGRQFISSNPDHIAEIVVGSGPGMFATVNVYNAVPLYPVLVNTFNPISPSFRGGVSVSTLYGVPAAADAILVAAGVGGGSTVNTFVGVNKIKSAAFAAFYGTSANRSPVYTAAIDASNIFSVQGSGGKINGVNKNTNPNGGTSSTLIASKSFESPLRIGILRR
ncbi:MAG: DUF11 domain-containing protein [Planctomycetota bacterium]|nr:MAG: DUF11 domain-containing protein [Planctomycetota bacterium]